MSAAIIGITSGEVFNRDRPNAPLMYGQNFTYTDAIIHGGGVPVILPLTKNMTVVRALYEQLDGLLLAGGNDVDPAYYNQEPHPQLGVLSPRRDQFEMQMLAWAEQDKKPVLAICRGMQLLNVSRGGSLYQDIASELPDAQDHATSYTGTALDYAGQKILLEESSKLAGILETAEILANTYHHQAVRDIGKGLQAVAWAEDQIIEGLEDPSRPFMLGVQCHPESLEATSVPEWQRLFTAFVEASADYAGKAAGHTLTDVRSGATADQVPA